MEKIRVRPFGKVWIVEVLSAVVKKRIVVADWPTRTEAMNDLQSWCSGADFEVVP
jgi:hypothetical protein